MSSRHPFWTSAGLGSMQCMIRRRLRRGVRFSVQHFSSICCAERVHMSAIACRLHTSHLDLCRHVSQSVVVCVCMVASCGHPRPALRNNEPTAAPQLPVRACCLRNMLHAVVSTAVRLVPASCRHLKNRQARRCGTSRSILLSSSPASCRFRMARQPQPGPCCAKGFW